MVSLIKLLKNTKRSITAPFTRVKVRDMSGHDREDMEQVAYYNFYGVVLEVKKYRNPVSFIWRDNVYTIYAVNKGSNALKVVR